MLLCFLVLTNKEWIFYLPPTLLNIMLIRVPSACESFASALVAPIWSTTSTFRQPEITLWTARETLQSPQKRSKDRLSMLVNLQKTRRAWTIQEAPEDRKKKKKKRSNIFLSVCIEENKNKRNLNLHQGELTLDIKKNLSQSKYS